MVCGATPLGLKLDEYRFDGFILDDKKYIYNTEDNQMGELYAEIQGETWDGKGMKRHAIKMFEDENFMKSQLTPSLFKLFTDCVVFWLTGFSVFDNSSHLVVLSFIESLGELSV